MNKKYLIQNPDKNKIQQLARSFRCPPLIAKILINRGITTTEAADKFFKGNLRHLRPPFGIMDMDRAVSRIHTALNKKEKILIFGDYDADGITATILLFEFFQWLNAPVYFYIPHRIKEGYGLAPAHIHRVATPKDINLIITVDCGSSSHLAVETANANNIDVIITDHHQLPETLPDAVAVVNPKREDCNTGFEDLAGVGVAYALIICLRKYLREKRFWSKGKEPNLKALADLVAIGTVADIVPLRDDNRILTKTGMSVIRSGQRPGLNALARAAGLDERSLTSDDIAFRLAPRINAAGRIAHAAAAVRLLTTKDTQKSQRIAECLHRLNAKRQTAEQKILSHILRYIDANPPLLQRNSLVFHHPDWHEGVLGIVAAKLVERFYRPVVLLTVRHGYGKGSARSIHGFNLYKGLEKASAYLESYGGHAMAAGLRLKEENISLFQQSFENVVTDTTRPHDFVPSITIDHQIHFSDISPSFVNDLEKLQPFGEQNPEPLFLAKNVNILFSRIVGEKHRQLRLGQSTSKSSGPFSAIQFNISPEAPAPTFYEQVAFRVRWNRWNGDKTIQLILEKD